MIQKEFDGILMGTRGIPWELFGNLMGNQAPKVARERKPDETAKKVGRLCMCTFYRPATLSASGFQGEARQNP